MKKKELKLRIILANEELISISQKLFDVEKKLNDLEKIRQEQMAYIEHLIKTIAVQDKAIERKDKQFEGLKSAYKDDLINGHI